MTTIDVGKVHLVVFLSRNTPLARWKALGIYERETALYRQMAGRLGKISLLTGGGPAESEFQADLGEIEILNNHWGYPVNLYSLLSPFLHRQALRGASLYKTNQLDGAWSAILAQNLYHKPAIVRAGYLWAESYRQRGAGGWKLTMMEKLEIFVLRQADQVFLTTPAMKQQVLERYHLPAAKIHIVPNAVDSRAFRPLPKIEKQPGQIVCVSRLDVVKNLHLLIQAIAQVPGTRLVLIGEGPQRAELEDLALRLGAQVDFRGVLPNLDIPAEINRSQIFVLPSAFEGHPKALLEAMSCGAAVIGTDVPGIRELVQHRVTGWLCAPGVPDLCDALQALIHDALLRQQMGQAARRFILENFSLEKVAELELELIGQIAGQLK